MSATYTELHARSAYSFLRGASLPEHLVNEAVTLGLPGVALCDRNGFYGVPRFTVAARERPAELSAGPRKLQPITGCELTMSDGSILPVLVESTTGYHNLCALLSRGHL